MANLMPMERQMVVESPARWYRETQNVGAGCPQPRLAMQTSYKRRHSFRFKMHAAVSLGEREQCARDGLDPTVSVP